MRVDWCVSSCSWFRIKNTHSLTALEVSRLDIPRPRWVCVCVCVYSLTHTRPRWVARIGVTRSTEACFLTADRQCTELPLLRLPRLVPEVARG